MVKNNGVYAFLKNVRSYYGIDTIPLFPEYEKIMGKDDGYYMINNRVSLPDSTINFKGNVYLLVNENSKSAATLFPALVHKYKRGIIVGRETGNCYYQMNAVKSVTVRLENSQLELKMPLMKVIFDDQMDPSIPWGRGVIPDYTVSWTYDEYFNKTDPILDYTRNLISKQKTVANNFRPSW